MIEHSVVPKPNALIQIYAEIGINEQKIFNFIIFSILNKKFDKNNTITSSNKELSDFLGAKIHPEQLKENFKNLMRIIIEVDVFKEDINDWELDRFVEKAKNIDGKITFKVSQNLIDNILSPAYFTKLDFKLINTFSSKYTMRLYENLYKYLCNNRYVQLRKLSVDDLKNLLGLPINRYKIFSHFKAKVIDIAVNEINKKSFQTVKYKTIKSGSKVSHIKFTILDKNANKLSLDRVLFYGAHTEEVFTNYLVKYVKNEVVGTLNNQNIYYNSKNGFIIKSLYGDTILNPQTAWEVKKECFEKKEKFPWFDSEIFSSMLKKYIEKETREKFS